MSFLGHALASMRAASSHQAQALLEPAQLYARRFSSVGASTSIAKGEQSTAAEHAQPSALQEAIAEATQQRQGPRRFYKTVNVLPVQQGSQTLYQVALDSRPIKTPGKHPLMLPTRPLALAIAAEWEWQRTGKPQPHTMPMMSLAAMAIDQPKPREALIRDLLRYAHTDVTCCRYQPGKVADKQAEVYKPLLEWAQKDLGWQLESSDSIEGPTQSDGTIAAVQAFLEGLDAFQLCAMEQLTATCKSAVLAAAVLRGRITADEALQASRLEESLQVQEWGMVEAGHDLDIAEATTRITAPSIFFRLLLRR